ncbi:MAG: MOSC domain-containing protein [Actinomycetia bacterium]|nr:MOSC domain-containing protein [Actinomycetes bacterium]
MLDGTLADQLGPLDDESPDASTLAARIAGFADRIPTLVDQAGDTSVTLVGEPEPFDGAALLAYVVEAGEWSLHRLGRLRAQAGDGPPPGLVGRLDGIHVSDGGIPKLPVSAAGIDGSGVAGDRQATRMHHGCPWQAVSLWSADIIDELAAEGHLIGPGAAGENLTLRGLVWRTLRPGVRLGVGPVVLELTAWAEPCQQVADLFVDARSWWIDHDLYPGRARVYARVVRSGPVGVGDEVVIEPELDLVDQPS